MHRDLMKALSRKLWIAAYTAEEARERNAQQRSYMRSAAWCVVLALLALANYAAGVQRQLSRKGGSRQ